ncbi:hypothetical protein FN846DRAFT_970062 [Sphaerosporella brunnea]|uniref:Uncharacterized protein n=1 Tax=Sphaerosporella brunnea TaxID=1250544 RepID=A0A5J5EI08_9PEZI|nr:hypothetical protein FN846DRAFT_970062 [Sphaerosporella brunnea]
MKTHIYAGSPSTFQNHAFLYAACFPRTFSSVIWEFLLWSFLVALAATSANGQTPADVGRGVACTGIDGNNDMYGLGIQTGVYLQS